MDASGCKDEILYVDFSSEYLDNIINVASSRFGENYITKESFLKHANKEQSMCTLAISKDTNEVLGYCVFFEEDIDSASKDFKISKEEMEAVSGPVEKICHTKSMALKEDCESRGIGYNLFKKTLDKAKDLGYKVAWCPAWKRGDFVPVKKVLLKNDFTYFRTVSNLWSEDKNYKCIVCNGPCTCDAEIYYKILN